MASRGSPGFLRHFKLEKTITAILSWDQLQLWRPSQNKKFHLFNEQSAELRDGVWMLLGASAKLWHGTENNSQMGTRWWKQHIHSAKRWGLQSYFQMKAISVIIIITLSLSQLPSAIVSRCMLTWRPRSWGEGKPWLASEDSGIQGLNSTRCWKPSTCLSLCAADSLASSRSCWFSRRSCCEHPASSSKGLFTRFRSGLNTDWMPGYSEMLTAVTWWKQQR